MQIKLNPLPPEQAIQFFRLKRRLILSAEQYYRLRESVRATAFTVSRVTAAEVLNDIYDACLSAIENGEPFDRFMARLDDIMAERGWTGLQPWHAETVFRTNIQTAYSVGRWEQIQDVKNTFPYLQYDAIDDDRVRPTHQAMNGRIFPVDSPVWDTWMPPNGFNCRCSVRPISQDEAELRGLLSRVETDDPTGKTIQINGNPAALTPDPGFAVNPAKSPYKPNLDKYHPSLQQMLRQDGIGEKQ